MSKIRTTVVKENNGMPIRAGDVFSLSYVVALSLDDLLANRHIDSSEWYGRSLVSGLERVELLPGLREALSGRCFGDTLRVEIPADLAFGSRGVPGRVPPNTTLFVQVEIVEAASKM